jgi:hypothetical protein
LLNNLAEVCRETARYADAEPLHKQSLAVREKALGPATAKPRTLPAKRAWRPRNRHPLSNDMAIDALRTNAISLLRSSSLRIVQTPLLRVPWLDETNGTYPADYNQGDE